MIHIQIELPCDECDGYAYVADRHPNDPSCQEVKCMNCDDDGSIYIIDTLYNIDDVYLEYPNAKTTEKLRCI